MPTYLQLKDRSHSLMSNYAVAAAGPRVDTIQSSVILSYSQRVSNTLVSIFSLSEKEAIHGLEQFLKDNWTLVQGTMLSYTAIPQHDITQLLCDVARYVTGKKNDAKLADEPTFAVIKLLMPTIATESLQDAYPNLDDKVDINTLLQTHVLGSDGLSLLPARLLANEDVAFFQQQRPNPYYDFQIKKMSPFIDDEELARLVGHSSFTRDVFDSKKRYDIYADDKSNLLGHLRQLCAQLAYNSVGSSGGVGSEENAGMGVYSAILSFNSYYELLGEEKDKIPKTLRAEIEKLLRLSSNSAININATANLETCVATRRGALINQIRGQEGALSQIGLKDGNTRTKILLEAKTQFEVSKAALNQALEQHQYRDGQDKLGITLALLTVLGVQVSIQSKDDLEPIKTLAHDEVTAVFAYNPELKQQFVDQVQSIENLVIFSISTAPNKLKAIFTAIVPALYRDMIVSHQTVAALLISFDAERCKIICEALREGYYHFLLSVNDLAKLLCNLNSEQRSIFLNTMKEKLPEIIKTPAYFENVLLYSDLSPEQRSIVLDAMQVKIPDMIPTLFYLKKYLRALSLQHCSTILDSIKERLPSIITSAVDVHQILNDLNSIRPEFGSIAINAIKNKLPYLILSMDDVRLGFYAGTAEQQWIVLDAVKERLPFIIKNGYDLRSLIKHFSPEQGSIILDAMTESLPTIMASIMASSRHRNHFLGGLTPNQYRMVITHPAMKNILYPNCSFYLKCLAGLGAMTGLIVIGMANSNPNPVLALVGTGLLTLGMGLSKQGLFATKAPEKMNTPSLKNPELF